MTSEEYQGYIEFFGLDHAALFCERFRHPMLVSWVDPMPTPKREEIREALEELSRQSIVVLSSPKMEFICRPK